MSHVEKFTDGNFEQEVLGHDAPVLVDFWAAWCGPCRAVAPTIDELAQQYGDRAKIGKLDVDENPETPPRFNIMGLPTLLFLRNGVEIGRQVGIVPYEALQKLVEELLHQP